jgi:hypothetical protein
MTSEKVHYIAKTHTTGGRDGGASHIDDGHLDPKFMARTYNAPSIDEYLRKRLMPVEGSIPHVEGIEMYGKLAPAKDAKPVRFVVRLDGAAPGENCGADTAPNGSGEIREPQLCQLIRQEGPILDRTFEIEFLDPGVHALAFTFGSRLRGTKLPATLLDHKGEKR